VETEANQIQLPPLLETRGKMFKNIDYNQFFVIGCPMVPWKVERSEHNQWLSDAAAIKESFPNAKFFAALELDHRSVEESYGNFIQELVRVGGEFWTYSINDKEEEVNHMNRWIRIETGRNLIREFAQRKRRLKPPHWGEEVDQISFVNNEAVLYVDSDIELTKNVVEKLFEVDHHIVSADVPAYGLRGNVVNQNPRIEEHWNTAGVLLVNSPHFYDLPWYHNAYMNLSDDPTFQHLAERLYGRQTFVRKDIKVAHRGALTPVEQRNIPKRKYESGQ
jgi:hypothetical protein